MGWVVPSRCHVDDIPLGTVTEAITSRHTMLKWRLVLSSMWLTFLRRWLNVAATQCALLFCVLLYTLYIQTPVSLCSSLFAICRRLHVCFFSPCLSLPSILKSSLFFPSVSLPPLSHLSSAGIVCFPPAKACTRRRRRRQNANTNSW